MSDAMSEGRFSTDTEGLDAACSPEIIRLHDGDSHQIDARPLAPRLEEAGGCQVLGERPVPGSPTHKL